MKWFLKCLSQYADFKGRARRKEYWMFQLFYWLILLLSALVLGIILGVRDVTGVEMFPPQSRGHDEVALFYYILLFLPGLAVTVRRLHDVGKSGWITLPWIILFLSYSFTGGVSKLPVPASILLPTVIVLVVLYLWMYVLLMLNSKSGANKYGPNPKEE